MVTTKMNGVNLPEFPELQSAKGRVAQMQTALTRNKEEAAALNRQVNEFESGSRSRANQAVEALLNTGEVPEDVGDLFASLNERLRKKWREQEVVKEALLIAERQEDAARSKACQELATALRPKYVEILKRMRTALLALQEVAKEEQAFADGLIAAGFSGTFSYLERLDFPHLGVQNQHDLDAYFFIAEWQRRLRQYYGV